MPEKFGQKALFTIMNLLGSLAIMFIILAATGRLGKADVVYVDKQDAALKVNIDENKDDNEAAHLEMKDDIKEGFKEAKKDQDENRRLIIEEIKRER